MKLRIWLIGTVVFFIVGCAKEGKEATANFDFNSLKTEEIRTFQPDTIKVVEDEYFDLAFQEIKQMLEDKIPMDFKRAVFLVEWAYTSGRLDYTVFCKQISKTANDLREFIVEKGVGQYKTAGNYALFEYFTKPFEMNGYKPFIYDFNDFQGHKDHRNVFVTKLMETHKGQCLSMPMYYKILSEEIGAESYLALGPNHMYIKHLDEQGKWVNIELTNGNFSSDSWMISSLDISAESIRNGVYMKELSMKESIAYCLLQLALAYEHKHGFKKFGLLSSETTLKYFPNCMPALMTKYNVLRKFGLDYIKKNGNKPSAFIENNHKMFKETATKIEELGFREMSPDKYELWLKSMEEQQRKISQSK
jgi:hypothetical protein